ncbi:hypothetical protein CY34DRAFT_797487 [Suillus luteus UH-Slu-Lm8-n1]|uniref:Uncharacterized protein n=1 Tax=Suillus luteus UH-Slu-Lm8-n1 TaxID=930992 RepID=A0A0D0B4X1_9AGAM|nr:hypothetical protein CY34DRAFT_797487 [Suillus luteus UH-Slu-Lm8-n1]
MGRRVSSWSTKHRASLVSSYSFLNTKSILEIGRDTYPFCDEACVATMDDGSPQGA